MNVYFYPFTHVCMFTYACVCERGQAVCVYDNRYGAGGERVWERAGERAGERKKRRAKE